MRAGTPIDLKQWRKQWSHPPTPIPANAAGLWYSEECVDQMLADFAKLVEERERVLREALERTVWRERSQFPGNPFCVICGAGKKWAAIHGHEASCPLATPTAEQPAQPSAEKAGE